MEDFHHSTLQGYSSNSKIKSSLVAQQVKDPALSLMWLGLLLWPKFSPWLGNFIHCGHGQKKFFQRKLHKFNLNIIKQSSFNSSIVSKAFYFSSYERGKSRGYTYKNQFSSPSLIIHLRRPYYGPSSEVIEKVGEKFCKQIISNQYKRCFHRGRNIVEWEHRQKGNLSRELEKFHRIGTNTLHRRGILKVENSLSRWRKAFHRERKRIEIIKDIKKKKKRR